jgi:hypothetical protein
MSLEDKRDKIMKKRACFICLRSAEVTCPVCKKAHLKLLCPEASSNKKEKEAVPTVQTNLNCTNEVLLRTLMMKLVNPVTLRVKTVRILLGCGSQR